VLAVTTALTIVALYLALSLDFDDSPNALRSNDTAASKVQRRSRRSSRRRSPR
jgi:hypothetical protein